MRSLSRYLCAFTALATLCVQTAPAQKNDEGYTAKIREYTTETYFLTELVDHLPASATVPSPDKVIGYAVGTPNKLTYSKDIYRYMRALEKATPRVKVFNIGQTEEGREMLVVAVSDEENIRKLDQWRANTARLADPRKTSQAEADQLSSTTPVIYWASGSIHSPETGSPEMLMEMAYRIAVEETPFIQDIRKNSVVLITPLVEVDGHDKEVDVYNYKQAHPAMIAPSLVYWGKYVAHDNNRDAMAMALALSRNMMRGFLDFHPQVLHDLHESVPFLYISTGMGPYNAWLDPIVVDEWQKMAYYEIEEMTKRSVPGVWTHGFYDGWAANYMFYVANGHNSIGRFYETFGGRGADTADRSVPANQTSRTWFRPNPPLPRVKWSLRNNINMQQSALLFGIHHTGENRKAFLDNFYLKGKRSIEKATKEGPAAWVLPASDPRPLEAADLVKLLQAQGVEVHRADAEIASLKVPARSYVVRMDQPYSRMADMLLDTQYYNVSDPRPYDDTGWTLGALRNVKTVRVTDAAILKAPMTLVDGAPRVTGSIQGDGEVVLLNHNAENALATLRYKLPDVPMSAAEEAFKAAGRDFSIGSFIIPSGRARLEPLLKELGLTGYAVTEPPKVAMHSLQAARIALVHTWLNTQNEGWYRVALDSVKVPYEYISDQTLARTPNLRQKYDVILFGPVGGSSQRIVNGLPKRGDPIPWKKSDLTPNLGMAPDQTDDMRGGMGLEGLLKLQDFVDQGGLFITIGSNASIPIDYGLIDGVSISTTRELQAQGSVLNASLADKKSPIAYGYPDQFAVYFNQAPVFQVAAIPGAGGRGGGAPDAAPSGRPSGRGTVTDPDIPQGRPYIAPPRPGSPPPDEMNDAQRALIPPPELRVRTVVKFADEKELLVSGMLAGGRELAGRPAVVDVPRGKGHIVMFANNPMWRQETQGSFFLLFNAVMNYDHLQAGRQADAPVRPKRGKAE